jgi:hypothetical protein
VNAATFSFTCARTDAAMAFPSISLAVMRHPPVEWSHKRCNMLP